MQVKKVFRLRLNIMLDMNSGVQIPDTTNTKELPAANLVEQNVSTSQKKWLREQQFHLVQPLESNNHPLPFQKYELNHK